MKLPPKQEIGARIRAARAAAGISQGELARRCGMRQGPVCNIEHGIGYPSLPVLADICEHIMCSPDEILFGSSSGLHARLANAERMLAASNAALKLEREARADAETRLAKISALVLSAQTLAAVGGDNSGTLTHQKKTRKNHD